MEVNNSCCKNSSCSEEKRDLNKEVIDNKPKTTCCACTECACGDFCTCPSGTVSCDPCQVFVDSKKIKDQ